MRVHTFVPTLRTLLPEALLLCTIAAAPAIAQDGPFQLRAGAGGFAPGSGLKGWVSGSSVIGLEASYEFSRYLGVTASTFLGDTQTRMYDGEFGDAHLWQYDAGLEGRVPALSAGIAGLRVGPFVGLGIGQRSYDMRSSFMTGSTSGLTTYGALGLDFMPTRGHLGFRTELRDDRSSFVDVSHLIPRATYGDLTYFIGLTWR